MRRPCGGRHRFTTAPTKQVLTDARCPQRVPPVRGGAHPRCGLCRARSRRRHDRQLRAHRREGPVLDHAGRPGPAHRRGEPARPRLLERRHARARSRTASNTAWPPTSRTGSGLDKVGVVNVAWDALVAGQTRNYDLALSQASITDERKKVVDFSVPYFSSDIGVLVKKGTDGRRDLDQGRAARRAAGDHRRRPSSRAAQARRRRPRCSPTRPRCSRRCMANQIDAAMTDTAIVLQPGGHVGRQHGGGRPVRHRRELWRASTPRARPTPPRSTR